MHFEKKGKNPLYFTIFDYICSAFFRKKERKQIKQN